MGISVVFNVSVSVQCFSSHLPGQAIEYRETRVETQNPFGRLIGSTPVVTSYRMR